jgi:hypothetical protein
VNDEPVSDEPVSSGDAVDNYLDQLADALVLRGRSVRRILAETEAHLWEAAADGERRGLAPARAEQDAVERFGPPATVARRFAAAENRLPSGLVWSTLLSLALVAGIGLVAIGVSGGVAAAMGAVAGKPFVAADAPGVAYTPERCAEYRALVPGATSCEQAALDHHYDEVVGYRLDAGVLGVIVLAGWWFVRRRRVSTGRTTALPATYTAAGGAVLFGVAAFGMLGLGTMQAAFAHNSGEGQLLSGGIVALLVAAGFGLWLLRSRRSPLGDDDPTRADPALAP